MLLAKSCAPKEHVFDKGHRTWSLPRIRVPSYKLLKKCSVLINSLGKYLVTLSISREKTGFHTLRQLLREFDIKDFLVTFKIKQTRKLKEENGRMNIML